MSDSPMMGIAQKAIGWSIGLSVLMILAGVLAIFMPLAAGVAASIVVGWLIVFSGAAHLLFGWHTKSTGALLWELFLGIVYTCVGIDLLFHPIRGLLTLTFALVLYLFLEGILELVMGFRLRPLPGSGWFLFDAVLTLVLAVLIWKTLPSNTEWVVGTLIGISMLFSGFTRLMLALAARRLSSTSA